MNDPLALSSIPSAPESDIKMASPEDTGTDSHKLEQAHQAIQQSYPKMHSMLVVRRGKLIFERYYGGYHAGSLNDLRSATKSFLSLLAGIAISQRDMPPIDAPILEVLHNHLPAAYDPRLHEITLRHLLTMTSGFQWITGKKLGEPLIRKMHRSSRWGTFALGLPLIPEEIGRFQYRSTDSHLISMMLRETAGCDAFSYAQKYLFAPLGISHAVWSASPEGDSMGHIGLFLTARELAQTGICLLNGGCMNAVTIIPKEWLEEALTPQAKGYPAFGDYGYQFWTGTICGQRFALAHGHGGQQLLLLPELEAAVVFTADAGVTRWKNPRRLVEQYLIPAMS